MGPKTECLGPKNEALKHKMALESKNEALNPINVALDSKKKALGRKKRGFDPIKDGLDPQTAASDPINAAFASINEGLDPKKKALDLKMRHAGSWSLCPAAPLPGDCHPLALPDEGGGQRPNNGQSDSNRSLPLSLVKGHLQRQSAPWGWGSKMRLWRGTVRLWALK